MVRISGVHHRFAVLTLSLASAVTGLSATGGGTVGALQTALATAESRGVTVRVSVSSNEDQQVGESLNPPAISARGRYVAFSGDPSLAPGPLGLWDIFLRDRTRGTTTRMSASTAGEAGNGFSTLPAITPHGRYVAFVSDSSNLVPGDTNSASDVFLRDRKTGRTTRVSVTDDDREIPDGAALQTPAISANGRFVAFSTVAANVAPRPDTNQSLDVFLRDRRYGTTRRISVSNSERQGNSTSENAAISSNGRFIAFSSTASNLVRGDTNGVEDVFVRDRKTGTTRRVSISSTGAQADDGSSGPTISPNGRFVGFFSFATTLVPGPASPFAGYARDRLTGSTCRVTVGTGGVVGNDGSGAPHFSTGGRYVTFWSRASNLVVGDTNQATDVFLRDRMTGNTRRVSVSTAGVQGNAGSDAAAISADGHHVAFNSAADNLVPRDSNFHTDTFVRDIIRTLK